MNYFSSIKFNRNELSGAFGDIGTDLPLIIGMLLASDFNTANVLVLFGAMQVLTGLIYKMPMAVQPLKAVALIVITQKISGDVVLAGGLVIGVLMFILSVTGLLSYLEKLIPKTIIRGIQFGLGIQLSLIALKDYIPSDQIPGFIIAGIGFVLGLVFIGNKKYPPALFIIFIGIIYSLVLKFDYSSFAVALPAFSLPVFNPQLLWTGFALLALPQIPLSIGNSVFATKQVAHDLFPEKKITTKKIGFTYSFMNVCSSLFGGIPVCHGSGGLVGQYNFGGRTGASAIIYGLFYIFLGLAFSGNFPQIIQLFPKPILGVILLFEGIALIILVKDVITNRKNFFIAVMVGLMACSLPYGYIIGMIFGIFVYYFCDKWFLKNYGK